MGYPQYARVNGKRIKINTSYKTALRCFNVINDDLIGDHERVLAVIYMLFGEIPEDKLIPEYLEKAEFYLQCGETKKEQDEKPADIDFNFDRKYINASFMSDYHIDLENSDMHFWQFCELIGGLTDKCVLSRVRYIRDCDLNDIPKSARADMRKAKRELALPERKVSDDDDEDDIFERQMRGEL